MKPPQEYIIFPLDVPDRKHAVPYIEELSEHVGLFKVGLELFVAEGPEIIELIQSAGSAGIFLDLKLHDIPATVTRAFLAASRHGPELVTVHCDQGEGFLKEVADNNPGGTKILGITVLTSLDTAALLQLGYRDELAENISRLVMEKAQMALDAGCHGIVCSGHEVERVKNEFGSTLIAVTPGIRPAWTLVEGDDQKRIVTPGRAVKAGSDYIVVGRPIRDAKSPADAARRVADEIAAVL